MFSGVNIETFKIDDWFFQLCRNIRCVSGVLVGRGFLGIVDLGLIILVQKRLEKLQVRIYALLHDRVVFLLALQLPH